MHCTFKPQKGPVCGRPGKPCPDSGCSYTLCPRHQNIHDAIHGAGDRWLAGLKGAR